MLDWKNAEAPDTAAIEALARDAIAALPPNLPAPRARWCCGSRISPATNSWMNCRSTTRWN